MATYWGGRNLDKLLSGCGQTRLFSDIVSICCRYIYVLTFLYQQTLSITVIPLLNIHIHTLHRYMHTDAWLIYIVQEHWFYKMYNFLSLHINIALQIRVMHTYNHIFISDISVCHAILIKDYILLCLKLIPSVTL